MQYIARFTAIFCGFTFCFSYPLGAVMVWMLLAEARCRKRKTYPKPAPSLGEIQREDDLVDRFLEGKEFPIRIAEEQTRGLRLH